MPRPEPTQREAGPLPPGTENDVAPPLGQVYETWFHDVCRWLRAMGIRDADLEDVAQDVFLVVRRKLPGFQGSRLAGWLYQIAYRRAREHRRLAWFRRVFSPRDDLLDNISDAAPGPAEVA